MSIINKIIGGGGGGGLASLSADTTPQLGGTLDVNGQGFSETLDAATGDEVAFDFSTTVNKATSGNYTLIKANATETSAPGTGNKLLDLQAGGVSQIVGTNAGALRVADGTSAAPSFSFLGDPDTGLYLLAAGNVSVAIGGNERFRFGSGGTFASADGITLGPTATSTDVALFRDAAGVIVLAQSAAFKNGCSLKMDLTTEDRGFINFNATADGDATSAISTLTTSGSVTHHIQIEINGTKAWIPASTNAPS